MINIILAFTALLGVILFFRIEKINDILIGDGQAAIERQKIARDNLSQKEIEAIERNEKIETDEPLINQKYLGRLRDAIYRKNIYGIEEGLLRISRVEISTKEIINETGYSNHALVKFKKTKNMLSQLKLMLVLLIMISLTIILIEGFLPGISVSQHSISLCYNCFFEIGKTVLTAVYFLLIIYSVFYSIYLKTPHEREKIKECDKLKL